MPAMAEHAPRTLPILGVNVANLGRDEALALLASAVATRRHMKIAFCNAHCANIAWSDPAFRETLGAFTVFADGVGVDIASRVLSGAQFKANLNGTDFVPALLAEAPRALHIAMIGGRPGVAESAAARLAQDFPQHVFGSVLHGFAPQERVADFLAGLAADPPDVLLVAMGNPLQERWIHRNVDERHATLAVGVGALFDFLAGNVSRAPPWLRRLRLEWVYRLMLEPRRLFRRYVLGNPVFLLRVLTVKAGLKAP